MKIDAPFPGSVEDFVPSETYDVIVSAGVAGDITVAQKIGEETGLEGPGATTKAPRKLGRMDTAVLDAVRAGTPLLCIPQTNELSDGCAQQLADAGAFSFQGNVGDFRAPWMGNWYFVREHALFAGMPMNEALGKSYQAKGRPSNGLRVEGPNVEIVVAYSRDHDRNIGAGCFTTSLGKGKIVFHRVPDFHPVMQQRFLANALWSLTVDPHLLDPLR